VHPTTGLLLSTSLGAQAAEGAPVAALRNGLGSFDWFVVAAYGIGMLAIGVYYSYRMKTSEDFYLGGRTMKPGMVGLSLFATMISTVTYLAVPGELMKHGPAYMATIVAIPFIYLIVGYLIIPRIMHLPMTSAYEFLEMRFGKPMRLLGCMIFLVSRFIWMGLVIFTCAKIVSHATGLPPEYVKPLSLALGVITIIYSSIGGLRAVVMTDVIQTAILFLGAILTVVMVSVKMRGFGWFPTEWAPNWDPQPLFSLDPTVRASVFGSVVAATTWWVCTSGSDQMAIQRYLATRDAAGLGAVRAARRAFLVNNVANACVTVILALLGFALLGFYHAHPEYLGSNANLNQDADFLFPHFIVNFLGYGLAGLVISGMLAAAMSSLSSGVNSTCTVINTDLLGYFLRDNLSERSRLRLARTTSFAVGAVVVLLSLIIGNIPGNLVDVTSRTSNLLVAPLFGLFFFGIFVPWATAFGTAFGSMYGFLAAFLMAFSAAAGWPAMSWQWILPTALVANLISGSVFSLLPVQNMGARATRRLAFVCAAPFAIGMVWFIMAILRN